MFKATADAIAKELLDESGYLKILPSAEYDKYCFDDLRLFCHFYGRYGLPTKELVDWLREYIGTQNTIEIGSGCGDLGRALGIPMIDNCCQEWPDVKAFYNMTGQPCIKYSPEIMRMDALDAAKTIKPDIIIGQWVTHWIDPDLPAPPGGGSMYGIKEDLLLKECKTYIMIGSSKIHGYKPILKLPHKELHFPFLRSRSSDPEANVIYIWENAA